MERDGDVHDLEKTADGWLWLDRRKTTRFKLDSEGKVAAAECNKKKATWVPCSRSRETRSRKALLPVYWARPGTSLKTVMLAMHRADTAPVAMFDEEEKFLGSVGVRNVLQAVLKRSD